MRLQKLTNLEQEKIFHDYEESIAEIKKFIKILSNPKELDSVMKKELETIKAEYGEKRRSTVTLDEGELKKEDLVKKEEVIVVLTKEDYVIRTYSMPPKYGAIAKAYVVQNDLLEIGNNIESNPILSI